MDELQRDYVSIKDACKYLGVHPQTIRKNIRSGKLKAFKPSWKILIAKTDLDAFMQASVYRVK